MTQSILGPEYRSSVKITSAGRDRRAKSDDVYADQSGYWLSCRIWQTSSRPVESSWKNGAEKRREVAHGADRRPSSLFLISLRFHKMKNLKLSYRFSIQTNVIHLLTWYIAQWPRLQSKSHVKVHGPVPSRSASQDRECSEPTLMLSEQLIRPATQYGNSVASGHSKIYPRWNYQRKALDAESVNSSCLMRCLRSNPHNWLVFWRYWRKMPLTSSLQETSSLGHCPNLIYGIVRSILSRRSWNTIPIIFLFMKKAIVRGHLKQYELIHG